MPNGIVTKVNGDDDGDSVRLFYYSFILYFIAHFVFAALSA